jgi:hypothetical protein
MTNQQQTLKDVQFSILDPISLRRGTTSIQTGPRKFLSGSSATTTNGVRQKYNKTFNEYEDTESY